MTGKSRPPDIRVNENPSPVSNSSHCQASQCEGSQVSKTTAHGIYSCVTRQGVMLRAQMACYLVGTLLQQNPSQSRNDDDAMCAQQRPQNQA